MRKTFIPSPKLVNRIQGCCASSPKALQYIQSSLGAVGVLHASQLTVVGYLHKAGCCRQAKPLPAAKGWEQRQCCPPEPAGGGRHQPCA